jgi:hypothetical protein
MSKSISFNNNCNLSLQKNIDLINLNITNSRESNILDIYDKEKITSSKDWHYRFDFYSNANINYINENTLQIYENSNLDFTKFIHSYIIDDDCGNLNSNLEWNDTENYIVKISTNILCKQEYFKINLRYNGSYKINPYSIFINNKYIYHDTFITLGTHDTSFKSRKGWNKLDIFIFISKYNNINKFYYINFAKQINTSFDIFDINQNKLDESQIITLKDNIEYFTAQFIDSSRLIYNDNIESTQFNIIDNTNESYFKIENSLYEKSNIIYSYEHIIWNDNYILSYNLINYNLEFIYTLDTIILSNISNSPFKLTELHYMIGLSSYSNIIPQTIETYYIYNNINKTIENNNFSHSLYNIHGLIENGYKIDFCISKKTKTSSLTSKSLEINNTLHTNSIYIQNDGSLGIGTNDTKTYSLYVNNIGSDKKGIFCEDDLTILSDIRYKTDIEPIINASNKLLKLNGVIYKKNGEKQMGLIAQEVLKHFPELVSSNGEKGEKEEYGIKYLNIIALLIEGFKELRKDVNMLM